MATLAIDWCGRETDLLLNPRMPREQRESFEAMVRELPQLEGHVWIATSGTSGAIKLAALSKKALLASAAAVNRHLDATPGDVWCCVLPAFHVGGLGIHARAELSGSRVVAFDWDAQRFAQQRDVTLASLVPAQVRDLVAAGLRAPHTMRAIVVGGGAVAPHLYEAAHGLGWPVLPSYGLTEACSQVATATGNSPALRLLSHVEARIEGGVIALRSAALLTGYGLIGSSGRAEFVDPKRDGWLLTEDRGRVEAGVLEVFGRVGEFVKIGGESVDLLRLDGILDSVRGQLEAALVPVPDERLGSVIHLAAEADPGAVVEDFNRLVHPFERIRGVHRVETIPRTALGKLRRSLLMQTLLPDSDDIFPKLME